MQSRSRTMVLSAILMLATLTAACEGSGISEWWGPEEPGPPPPPPPPPPELLPPPALLLAPASGATIPQNDATLGCPFSLDHGYGFAIAFAWSPVPGATAYHLRSYHSGSPIAMLDIVVTTSEYRFLACNSYVASGALSDWQWTVATVNSANADGPWAAEGRYQFGPYR